ncbi:hypothetical protein F8M41_019881 [Gigaspora margarita]|uniref:Uncharacterized protein n=1 Tax=Gigaspora margarita TaxID=4874 RepID=A0A8H4AJ67_GIGMA|nr:hypothetical protein F8M41_019881 [Gigaspora margarita]
MKLRICLQTEHQTLLNLIETTQKTHSYVQFGVYVEKCAKKLKWYEILNSTLYEPLEFVNAKMRILNLQFMDVNETVKTISKAFSKVTLSSNDLLLSGILDIESLNTLNSPIKEALHKKRLWSAVKEDLQLKPLPEGLKEFIIHYVETDNASISVPFDNSLFNKTRSLIDAVKKLWRMPKLQSCFAKYNESSWSHYALQPIMNFITDYKESDLCIRWDSVQSKASLERNNLIGPIKKPDIYGIVESEKHSDLELLLGEISNGPFNQSVKAQKHTEKDKIKLSKCGKDALDSIMRKYMKSQSNNLEKLNVFLLHAHGTFLEFFIIDKKIAPFSRLRKLAILEIPFKNGSTQELIRLIQVLYTFNFYIDNNLEIIRLIEEECKNINDSEVSENGEEDENEKDDVGVENEDEDIIDRVRPEAKPILIIFNWLLNETSNQRIPKEILNKQHPNENSIHHLPNETSASSFHILIPKNLQIIKSLMERLMKLQLQTIISLTTHLMMLQHQIISPIKLH